MKHVGISAFWGLLLAMVLIYILQPLNSGAIGLVVLLAVGCTTAAGAALRSLLGKGGRE